MQLKLWILVQKDMIMLKYWRMQNKDTKDIGGLQDAIKDKKKYMRINEDEKERKKKE